MRHLAAEKGVNLEDVPPTGKGGRVVKEDILNYLERQADPGVSHTLRDAPSVGRPTSAEDRVESITGFKKVMVHTMTESGVLKMEIL